MGRGRIDDKRYGLDPFLWGCRDKLQRQTDIVFSQGIRCGSECSSAPVACFALRNIPHPVLKCQQGFTRESAQINAGRLLFRQPGIEQLLQRPRRFAELHQPDHAGTAFERMEGASQRCLLGQVVGIDSQPIQCAQAIGDDFIGLFQEDVLKIVFVNFGDLYLLCIIGWGLRRVRNQWRRTLVRRHPLYRASFLPGQFTDLVGNSPQQRKICRPIRAGNCRLTRFCKPGAGRGWHWRIPWRRLHQVAGDRESDGSGRSHPPHDRLQLPEFRVKGKELPGQRGLVVEHVDEQAKGAKVVAKPIKGSGDGRQFDVHLGNQHLLDAVTHADDSQ